MSRSAVQTQGRCRKPAKKCGFQAACPVLSADTVLPTQQALTLRMPPTERGARPPGRRPSAAPCLTLLPVSLARSSTQRAPPPLVSRVLHLLRPLQTAVMEGSTRGEVFLGYRPHWWPLPCPMKGALPGEHTCSEHGAGPCGAGSVPSDQNTQAPEGSSNPGNPAAVTASHPALGWCFDRDEAGNEPVVGSGRQRSQGKV